MNRKGAVAVGMALGLAAGVGWRELTPRWPASGGWREIAPVAEIVITKGTYDGPGEPVQYLYEVTRHDGFIVGTGTPGARILVEPGQASDIEISGGGMTQRISTTAPLGLAPQPLRLHME